MEEAYTRGSHKAEGLLEEALLVVAPLEEGVLVEVILVGVLQEGVNLEEPQGAGLEEAELEEVDPLVVHLEEAILEACLVEAWALGPRAPGVCPMVGVDRVDPRLHGPYTPHGNAATPPLSSSPLGHSLDGASRQGEDPIQGALLGPSPGEEVLLDPSNQVVVVHEDPSLRVEGPSLGEEGPSLGQDHPSQDEEGPILGDLQDPWEVLQGPWGVFHDLGPSLKRAATEL